MPVEQGPVNPAPDPVARGDTPGHVAQFDAHYHEPTMFPNAISDEVGVGARDFHKLGAAEGRGRMDPMDEYRLLGDGTHA